MSHSYASIDRSAFSVVSLDAEDDERAYWWAQTPEARLRHMEWLRSAELLLWPCAVSPVVEQPDAVGQQNLLALADMRWMDFAHASQMTNYFLVLDRFQYHVELDLYRIVLVLRLHIY